jgi:ribonuclease HII
VPDGSARTLVGVDEAGRGAWVGPLVVGAVAIPPGALEQVRASGARDSKTLSPTARERVYDRLAEVATARSVELPPSEIDRHVRQGRLNELEARAFGEIVKEFAPATAYVDACDVNARRFGRRVADAAGPGVRVVARHHADRDHPLVGAASIVAKVRRDRAIQRLAEQLGGDPGSGYPSDERTVQFVAGRVAKRAPIPDWIRASWATTQRVIRSRPGRTLDDLDQ